MPNSSTAGVRRTGIVGGGEGGAIAALESGGGAPAVTARVTPVAGGEDSGGSSTADDESGGAPTVTDADGLPGEVSEGAVTNVEAAAGAAAAVAAGVAPTVDPGDTVLNKEPVDAALANGSDTNDTDEPGVEAGRRGLVGVDCGGCRLGTPLFCCAQSR